MQEELLINSSDLMRKAHHYNITGYLKALYIINVTTLNRKVETVTRSNLLCSISYQPKEGPNMSRKVTPIIWYQNV